MNFIDTFDYPSMGNYYGVRMQAVFVPQHTGNYVFHLSGDDYVRLLLGTDENESSATEVGYRAYYEPAYQWL